MDETQTRLERGGTDRGPGWGEGLDLTLFFLLQGFKGKPGHPGLPGPKVKPGDVGQAVIFYFIIILKSALFVT